MITFEIIGMVLFIIMVLIAGHKYARGDALAVMFYLMHALIIVVLLK